MTRQTVIPGLGLEERQLILGDIERATRGSPAHPRKPTSEQRVDLAWREYGFAPPEHVSRWLVDKVRAETLTPEEAERVRAKIAAHLEAAEGGAAQRRREQVRRLYFAWKASDEDPDTFLARQDVRGLELGVLSEARSEIETKFREISDAKAKRDAELKAKANAAYREAERTERRAARIPENAKVVGYVVKLLGAFLGAEDGWEFTAYKKLPEARKAALAVGGSVHAVRQSVRLAGFSNLRVESKAFDSDTRKKGK